MADEGVGRGPGGPPYQIVAPLVVLLGRLGSFLAPAGKGGCDLDFTRKLPGIGLADTFLDMLDLPSVNGCLLIALPVHSKQHPSNQGQGQAGFAAGAFGGVLESQGAAVGFGDLAAEHQSDARAVGLGGEEGHKKVGGVG
jgi:hypothetical protein